jgi:hypothetical protein
VRPMARACGKSSTSASWKPDHRQRSEVGGIPKAEGKLTIRELMEEQRRRVRSCNPAERLAAALLIPAELSKRLRLLGNSEIAQLLDEEVCANMNILAPEATVCVEVALRLRRATDRTQLYSADRRN